MQDFSKTTNLRESNVLSQVAQANYSSAHSMRGSFKGLAPTRHTRRESNNQNGSKTADTKTSQPRNR